jgi:copper transport protein
VRRLWSVKVGRPARVRRLWLVIAVVVVGVAGWAAPAFAHAVLESTSPPADAVLSKSPGSAVMHFGEDVEVSFGAIRVVNSDGKRVDEGSPYHPHGDGHAVAINMPDDLGPGGYVVTWRVISADSHPVHGAFTFQIGNGGARAAAASTAEAAKLLAAGAGSRTVGVLFGIIRFLAFGSLFVLLGGAAFVAGVWPAGRRDRRARRLLWAGLIVSVLTTALAIAIQGPYGGGLPLSEMVKPSAINAVLHTRFGVIYLARLALLVAVAGPLLRLLLRGDRPPRWWAPAALVTAAAILITPGLAGHAGTGMLIALAIPFDMIHLAGAAVWVGGLAVLVIAALAPRRGDDTSLRAVVSGYSQWALGAVLAIAVTGGFSAWRQVGSWSAVTTTTFGRLLLAKTIIFAVLVVLATQSRRIVHGDLALPLGLGRVFKAPVAVQPSGNLSPSLSPGPGATATSGKDNRRPGQRRARRRPTQPWRVRLRAAVLGEVILAAGIIAVSATLVNAQPARTSVALPYAAEVHAGGGVLVDVIVDPTRAGPVSIHLYTLTPAGAEIDVPEVDATFSLASAGINDLKVPLQKAGPGHYLAYDFDIPLRGTWKLQMTVRTTDIDEFNADPVSVHIH